MLDLEQEIVDILTAEGFQNLFLGTEKPTTNGIAQESIFVALTGGSSPDRLLNNNGRWDRVDIQVMVRSNPQEERASQQIARDIYNTLDGQSTAEITQIRAIAPPNRLGADDDDIFRWSINFTVNYIF